LFEDALDITALDWVQLSPLIDEALELAPSKRNEWLRDNAAARSLSPVLRAQLEALIAQSDAPETDSFLATLPALTRKQRNEVSFSAGDTVGPYELIGKIGTGGMSEVWRSKRVDGAYVREVALKLPYAHASVASRKHFIARMERERDLLAKLEHPNIARFYDAGVAKTALGAQPYLALEFVDGVTITQYANERRLTVRARCELFLQVLEAVQYAHQRLVVHRDLKPSNILVRQSGALAGKVALLDFGVAKVLADDAVSTDASQLTRELGRAVTLAYASPEQLLGEPISTATDTYSAGILFYELLCGRRPYAGHEKTLMSLLSALDHQTPPFTTTLKLDDTFNASAFTTQSLNAHLRAIRGDLSAICAKALRRDSDARYVSAAEFAQDLQRFLHNQPVLAREGALLYTLQKFFLRHRTPILVGAVGTLAAAGLGVTALSQRQVSHRAMAQADSVDQILTSLLEGMMPEVAESKTFSARELLDRTTSSVSDSVMHAGGTRLIERIAELYSSVGANAAAIAFLERQIASLSAESNSGDRLLVHSMLAQYQIDEGNKQAAEKSLAFARGEMEKIGSRATALHRVSLRFANAVLAHHTGDSKSAVTLLQDVESEIESQIDDDKTLWRARVATLRGHSYLDLRQSAQAVAEYKNAVSLFEKTGSRATVSRLLLPVSMARVEFERENFKSALATLKPVIAEIEQRYGRENDYALLSRYLQAASHMSMGELNEALAQSEGLLSSAARHEAYSALAKRLKARILLYLGRTREALELNEALLPQRNASTHEASTDATLSNVMRFRAECLLHLNLVHDARDLLLDLQGKELALPDTNGAQRGNTLMLLGITHLKLGATDAATTYLSDAVANIKTFNEFQPSHLLIAQSYLAIAAPTSANDKQRTDFALQIQQRFGWQKGAEVLVQMLRANKNDKDPKSIPIIF
jgi:eukaryotic-like serine/threonine-protein kinase